MFHVELKQNIKKFCFSNWDSIVFPLEIEKSKNHAVVLKRNMFLVLTNLCVFQQANLTRHWKTWDLGGTGNLVNVTGAEEPELQSSLSGMLFGSA